MSYVYFILLLSLLYYLATMLRLDRRMVSQYIKGVKISPPEKGVDLISFLNSSFLDSYNLTVA
jgi:hypothetical protein